ncbi:hypothetical protein D3C73_868870 [compost metagenome]
MAVVLDGHLELNTVGAVEAGLAGHVTGEGQGAPGAGIGDAVIGVDHRQLGDEMRVAVGIHVVDQIRGAQGQGEVVDPGAEQRAGPVHIEPEPRRLGAGGYLLLAGEQGQ